ncbi:Alpha amylase, catalytic domain [Legionella massiliensis]|uniref:Alpha amylase, catalytic domain n=1 Tax=Legionella massiliensis TaxID=1034943 RepID=A0A078KUN9_9GAMM|nr:alpha-amylase [Legionella massiliensis]CDZ78175.1 Alpha amylase, catalytic domain [Legionella massiliensis]CEE13913.1 Alpha amylase, catalytic domain [Legionella massiliensis]
MSGFNESLRRTSPVMDGNGILRCYNMFPTQFGSIQAMTAYLPHLREMGFNAVWTNPLQTPGNVEGLFKRDKTNGVRAYNQVSRSLYAMTDCDTISPYFSSAPPDADLDTKKEMDLIAMQEFTQTARENGLVSMFDLVLNHVSVDSRHREENPHWFNAKPHPDFKDAIAFDYSNPEIRAEIIEKFWKPYIFKYMIEYGYEGVRVDAVGYINPELRRELYEYIYMLAEKYDKPRPVILDELLFSGGDINEVVDKLLLPNEGPTHVTRSTYYAHRDQYGGLDEWFKMEEGVKSQDVFLNNKKQPRPNAKGGCIAFCGNHDHNSLAMTILEEMAEGRLHNYNALKTAKERLKSESNYDEATGSIFLYSFVVDIQNEIAAGNPDTIAEVEKRMREKIALCALSSSGGWYALSGDESGDLLAKPVFRRANAPEQTYYAQRTHKILSSQHEDYAKAMEVIVEMARQNIQSETAGKVFNESDPQTQGRLLVPYIETLRNQINCGDTVVCDKFSAQLRAKGVNINFGENDYIPNPRTPENGWQGRHDMTDFMRQINTILAALPTSNFNFWSEVIPIPSKPNLMAVVRKNGEGFSAPTDLVIVNLDPSKKVELTKDDIYQLACNFQKRVIPQFTYFDDGREPQNNWHSGNPDFNIAYQSVMSCMETKNIYVDSSITTKFPSNVVTPFNMFQPQPKAKANIAKMAQMSQEDTTTIEDGPGAKSHDKKEVDTQEGVTITTKVSS